LSVWASLPFGKRERMSSIAIRTDVQQHSQIIRAGTLPVLSFAKYSGRFASHKSSSWTRIHGHHCGAELSPFTATMRVVSLALTQKPGPSYCLSTQAKISLHNGCAMVLQYMLNHCQRLADRVSSLEGEVLRLKNQVDELSNGGVRKKKAKSNNART